MEKRNHILAALLAISATAAAQSSAVSGPSAARSAAPAALATPSPANSSGSSASSNGSNAGGTRNPSSGSPIRSRRSGSSTPAPVANNDVTITGSNAKTPDPSALVYGTASTGGIPDAPEKLPLLNVARPANPLGIRPGTPIVVRLDQPIDSAHAKNGQIIHGRLVNAVGSAPAGSRVDLTVVAAAAVGQMYSYGEISIQVIGINGQHVLSNVITAEGKEGPKLTADSAPGRGTEAAFTPDQTITLPAS